MAEACIAVGVPASHCGTTKAARRLELVAEGLELAGGSSSQGGRRLVLTLGAAGAAGVLGGAEWRVRTRAGDGAVNPVGSGDCFAAGLALALQRGEDPPRRCVWPLGRGGERRVAVQRRRGPGAGEELAGGASPARPRSSVRRLAWWPPPREPLH